MALLGLLSLVQILFLPGYLLLRAARVGTGVVATSVLSFALSLVVNHVLVAGLVVLGIYRPNVVYGVFALEFGFLLALVRRRLRMNVAETAATSRLQIRECFRAIVGAGRVAEGPSSPRSGKPGRAGFLRLTIVIAAVAVIGGFALAGVAQTGQIFEQWDAVVSWNRWAVDWAANRLPHATSIYPQLLPTNISLTYVFMRSSQVWVFAKAFQFVFCLMLLVAMLDLARIEGRFGYVPGVLVTYGLLVAILRYRMLSSGYVDVPLAFFAFVAVYALMLARNAPEARDRTRYVLLGALLAAGAALTKQNGLYIAAVYPLLAWQLVGGGAPARSTRLPISPSPHLPIVALSLLLVLIVSPWYLYKLHDIQAGRDDNNTTLLFTDFHEGRDLPERLWHACGMIVEATTPLGAALVLLAIAVSLGDRTQRRLLAVLVAPLGLIWALAFSYDLRNLAAIVPFVGAAAGMGLSRIFAWAAVLDRMRLGKLVLPRDYSARQLDALKPGAQTRDRRSAVVERAKLACASGLSASRTRRLSVGHVAALATLCVFAMGLCISDHSLQSLQDRQQRTVGLPELNRQLYAYAADHPGAALIATDYQAMRWLPELASRSEVCTCHEISAFRSSFDRPEVRCVLVRTGGAAVKVREFLKTQTAARLVFESCGFAFYEKPDRQRDEPSSLAAAP
jgi:hypothetical protein